MAREVLIVNGARTAIGDYGGSLKDIPPTELGARVVLAEGDDHVRPHVRRLIIDRAGQCRSRHGRAFGLGKRVGGSHAHERPGVLR